MHQISKGKIAKNTMMLYIRMVFIMIITLYTSRVVLEVLGVDEFGIYNIVGGVVVILSFLNRAMSGATQRFLSFEIGIGDGGKLKKLFTTSVIIHILIAFIIVILAETAGLWFLNNLMVIDESRMWAANWCYQLSILTFVVNVITVPYNAIIISYEKMNIFAYISILEVGLKLGLVLLLKFVDLDKLVLYSVLMFLVSLIVQLIYIFYSNSKFKECKLKFVWDKLLIKTMLSFSGWSLFGNIAGIAKVQGINVVLNLFFGATVNAAWAISQQVNAAIQMFIYNFTTALNPPIIKAYANGDINNTYSLLFLGMKYCFYLSFCLIMPLLLNTEYILDIWLKNVPEYTVVFTQFALITLLIESMVQPVTSAINATGRIKWNQIIVGNLLFLNLPIAYFAVKIYNTPTIVYAVIIVISILTVIIRLIILYKIIKYPLKRLLFIFKTIMCICIFNIPLLLWRSNVSESTTSVLISIIGIIILTTISFVSFGMEKNERSIILNKIKSLYVNIFSK